MLYRTHENTLHKQYVVCEITALENGDRVATVIDTDDQFWLLELAYPDECIMTQEEYLALPQQ